MRGCAFWSKGTQCNFSLYRIQSSNARWTAEKLDAIRNRILTYKRQVTGAFVKQCINPLLMLEFRLFGPSSTRLSKVLVLVCIACYYVWTIWFSYNRELSENFLQISWTMEETFMSMLYGKSEYKHVQWGEGSSSQDWKSAKKIQLQKEEHYLVQYGLIEQ